MVGPSRSPPELGMTSSTRAMSRYSSIRSTYRPDHAAGIIHETDEDAERDEDLGVDVTP